MQAIMIGIMESYGYAGTFFLILLENIFPPIPSEVILTFGGFMTTVTSMTLMGTILVSTLGSLLGAVILYRIGKALSREKLGMLLDRYGRLLRLKAADLDKADRWFSTYGQRTVFFTRMMPVIRSLISLPAGMAHMDFQPFLLYTALGTLLWNTLLISGGAFLGQNWATLLTWMDLYSTAFLVAAFLGILLYIILRKLRSK